VGIAELYVVVSVIGFQSEKVSGAILALVKAVVVSAEDENVVVSATGSQSEKVSGAVDAKAKLSEAVGVRFTVVSLVTVTVLTEELVLEPGRQAS
jgi:hypothetical protein